MLADKFKSGKAFDLEKSLKNYVNKNYGKQSIIRIITRCYILLIDSGLRYASNPTQKYCFGSKRIRQNS